MRDPSNQNAIVLYTPTQFQLGPQQNLKNPLLVRLLKICTYFTKENTFANYSRKQNFRDLIAAISSGDIQQALHVLQEGKDQFGKIRVLGVRLNPGGTERYYDLLVKLYDEKAINEANIKAMPIDLRCTELETFIQSNCYYFTKPIFGIDTKSSYSVGRSTKTPAPIPVTFEDGLKFANKFLDYSQIAMNHNTRVVLPAVEAIRPPVPMAPDRTLVTANGGMNMAAVQGLCERIRANEAERQALTRELNELQQQISQPVSPVVAPAAPYMPQWGLHLLDSNDGHPPGRVSSNTQSGRTIPPVPPMSQPLYTHANNQNGFLAGSLPAPSQLVHLQPDITTETTSGVTWDVLGVHRH